MLELVKHLLQQDLLMINFKKIIYQPLVLILSLRCLIFKIKKQNYKYGIQQVKKDLDLCVIYIIKVLILLYQYLIYQMNKLYNLLEWNGQKKSLFFVTLPRCNLYYWGQLKRNKKDLQQNITPQKVAEVLNQNEKCNLIFQNDDKSIDLTPYQQEIKNDEQLSTFKISYYEVSAKNGENIQNAIYQISKKVYEEKLFKKKKEKTKKNLRKRIRIYKNIN